MSAARRGFIAHRNSLLAVAVSVASALAKQPDPEAQALAKELPSWALPPKKRKKKRRNVLGLRP